jgi:hypothetical protein
MTPDVAKPEKKVEPKKPAGTKPTTAKKGDVNKSAEIRKVAAGMKAKGEKPRPVVIIDVLKKQGIEVSSPQVSMVLKKMGFRPRKRRKSGEAAVKSQSSAVRKSTKVTVDELVKAQKVVASMGGVERALAVIQALKNFDS